MPESLPNYHPEQKSEPEDDLKGVEESLSEQDLEVFMRELGPGEERPAFGSIPKQKERGALTPERVKELWDKLSDLDKRFIVSSQNVFDKFIGPYEERYGHERAATITGLRKLILSADPRAGLIDFKKAT